MSQHVKAALLASKGLSKTDRGVLVAIAAHMNKAGDAWPSVATIAEYADCSERTVQRSIARLINLGRIVWRHVAGRATRTYRLVVAAVRGVTTTGPGVTNQRAEVSDSAAEGATLAVTRSGEESLKGKGSGSAPRDEHGRLAWWQFKRSRTESQRPSYPERRGAALPPPTGTAKCQKPGHEGQPLHNCGPCRGEQNGGGVR
ncbi:helix-turn-helix domain-containing protein [Micromonospora inyonensis]|uniref:Helix-turn-helix domain-containing protein n=2 Tax=Micromonospora inyonensis TaxID=47866 RepID=A0A1C6RD38_9ACTN|nr:helix-turn-helix domain-containing protein [Micromonospora inyonensis]SCL15020.1 Helix-turn-helix domain-containing protein [Micromonospora inyonensis]